MIGLYSTIRLPLGGTSTVTSNHIRKGSSKNYFQSKFIILIRYQQYILQKQCVLDVFFNTSITGTSNEIVVEIWQIFFYYKKKSGGAIFGKIQVGGGHGQFCFSQLILFHGEKIGTRELDQLVKNNSKKIFSCMKEGNWRLFCWNLREQIDFVVIGQTFVKNFLEFKLKILL